MIVVAGEYGGTAAGDRRCALRQRLLDAGVVAVVRGVATDRAERLGRALLAGGVTAVEVTTTSPDFTGAIAVLRGVVGLLVGAGTLLDPAHDDAAVGAGAEFLVSPVLRPDMAARAAEAGLPSMIGGMTPTECLAAWRGGADFVKVFPSGSWGLEWVRLLRGPFPGMPLAPTGGLSPANLAEYRRAGCALAGVGSALVDPRLAASGAWEELTARARACRDAWRAGAAGL